MTRIQKRSTTDGKETGSQEPSGTDSSHKDQVLMIRPIGQVPMIRNKQNLKENVVSTVERNRHIPKVSHKEGEVLQLWEGKTLQFRFQIKE